MSDIEIVFIGDYNNVNDFRLKTADVPIDLSPVTQIDLNINGIDVTSTNQGNDLVRWDQPGYETGEIRCKLGNIDGLVAGYAQMWITIYDPTNPNGVVFEPIRLEIHALP